jgi:hypothetical protein
MSDNKNFRLELTQEQKAQISKMTGRSVDALEFDVRELEERIAPSVRKV